MLATVLRLEKSAGQGHVATLWTGLFLNEKIHMQEEAENALRVFEKEFLEWRLNA